MPSCGLSRRTPDAATARVQSSPASHWLQCSRRSHVLNFEDGFITRPFVFGAKSDGSAGERSIWWGQAAKTREEAFTGKLGCHRSKSLPEHSVDEANANLKQEVSASRVSSHLLRLAHALGDDLVDQTRHVVRLAHKPTSERSQGQLLGISECAGTNRQGVKGEKSLTTKT